MWFAFLFERVINKNTLFKAELLENLNIDGIITI